MQTYDVELQGSGLQLFDSGHFEVPDDYNVPFPTTDTYLCIPTQDDGAGGVKLDVYETKLEKASNLELRYSGEIKCDSGTLNIEDSLTGAIGKVSFEKPGKKHIDVWTNRKEEPNHVAICLYGSVDR